ncbi:alpha-1,3-glucosidase [Aureococcus anophagefferens]|nr:alpha-1,3-glucosidase [Aureococcus anophagefferens]
MRSLLRLALLGVACRAVDKSKFRTCQDTRFCRVHARPAAPPPTYAVNDASVAMADGALRFEVSEGTLAPLVVTVLPHADAGVVNVRVTEAGVSRWEPDDVLLGPFADGDALSRPRGRDPDPRRRRGRGRDLRALHAVAGPRGRRPLIVVNGKDLLHYERGSAAAAAAPSLGDPGGGDADSHGCEDGFAWNGERCLEIAGYWEDGLARRRHQGGQDLQGGGGRQDDGDFSETFSGHTDDVPNGPMSVGVDVSFPGSKALFGLAEHASQFALKKTTGGGGYDEPFRFYNLDVFEYDLDVPMALYGTIPLAWAVAPGREKHSTVGVFYDNPTETYVDVGAGPDDTTWDLHFVSESGVLSLFLILPETPLDGFAKYAALTGAQELPPLFALGYHQCRWNYKDEKDVAAVHGQFEALDIPYDVLWLDIEHTDGKRYFTWDANLFPDPATMQDTLAATGRKMVTIVDPPHQARQQLRLVGGALLSLANYGGSTANLYTWNDMNEPSVFNGPEVTMAKTLVNLGGVEHREWHNLYGMYFHRATAEGLMLRDQKENKRPFVLSRAFYAGSQRWGAIWTGDNAARWDHLKVASQMLLSISVCGLSFAGADAGGFFGDPDPELMVRWIQAAAYTPFFRGHAHHDAKRREPWSFGEPHTARMRGAIADRYALLPYWYTTFAAARFAGLPVMRPLWAHHAHDADALLVGDAWLVGEDLLVKPATDAGVSTVDVYLPVGTTWFETHTAAMTKRSGGVLAKGVPAPLDGTAPALQRGGSIIPRQRRLRRSTAAMRSDPYELTVALDDAGEASGSLYLDDFETFGFTGGAFHKSLRADERGRARRRAGPRRAADGGVAGRKAVEFAWNSEASSLVLRAPNVAVAGAWEIALTF